jgi:DNA-binding XRE family transcriptional regulator
MEVAATFGSRLKHLRETKDQKPMSQEDLAKGLEVSRASIGYYENATRTPDIEFLEKAASYFKVSYEYLLGKSESTKRENIDISKRLGLSDRMIEIIERMYKNTTDDTDSAYYTNRAKFKWKVFEQLFYSDAFITICNYIKQTQANENDFLVLSVHNGNQDEWIDQSVKEIIGQESPGAADKVAPPSGTSYVIDSKRLRNILMDEVMDEIDAIGVTISSAEQAKSEKEMNDGNNPGEN